MIYSDSVEVLPAYPISGPFELAVDSDQDTKLMFEGEVLASHLDYRGKQIDASYTIYRNFEGGYVAEVAEYLGGNPYYTKSRFFQDMREAHHFFVNRSGALSKAAVHCLRAADIGPFPNLSWEELIKRLEMEADEHGAGEGPGPLNWYYGVDDVCASRTLYYGPASYGSACICSEEFCLELVGLTVNDHALWPWTCVPEWVQHRLDPDDLMREMIGHSCPF